MNEKQSHEFKDSDKRKLKTPPRKPARLEAVVQNLGIKKKKKKPKSKE